MCSLKHVNERISLPTIIKAMKFDPRNLFALREGKDMFWSHVLSQAWNLG